MRPQQFTTSEASPLVGDIRLSQLLAEIPDDHVLKGMFFTRYVTSVGRAWSTLAGECEAPPADGRYHAFEFYPLRDYLRLFDYVARERFPGETREAYRLLARGEVEVFAESTLGKVTLLLLRDPAAALLRYPETFGILARGPEARATALGARRVRVDFTRYAGAIEYAVGVLEGLVLSFDESPTLDVTRREHSATLDVSW